MVCKCKQIIENGFSACKNSVYLKILGSNEWQRFGRYKEDQKIPDEILIKMVIEQDQSGHCTGLMISKYILIANVIHKKYIIPTIKAELFQIHYFSLFLMWQLEHYFQVGYEVSNSRVQN